jgi:hypothetical protein
MQISLWCEIDLIIFCIFEQKGDFIYFIFDGRSIKMEAKIIFTFVLVILLADKSYTGELKPSITLIGAVCAGASRPNFDVFLLCLLLG